MPSNRFDPSAAAEISQFADSVYVDQDVSSFNVAVHHSVRVEVLKALEDLLDVDADDVLVEATELFDHLAERAAYKIE